MSEKEGEKQLFKYYLDKHAEYHHSRPEFLYRTNRWRFATLMRRPLAFSPWYTFNGWVWKGGLLFVAHYILFVKSPYTKHWNREGYYYETQHKTSRPEY